jgi:predicted nucleotidyltransferase
MNRSLALSILGRLKPDLGIRYKVHKIGIFGSMARNEARPDSDVDILVDIDPSIGLRFVDLATEIEQAFGMPVDVVSRRAIDPARWKAIEPDVTYA